MKTIHDEHDHVVLEIPGFQLVIHALRGEPAPSRDTGGNVAVREDSYWKLCLPVENLAQARMRASELGGYLKSQENEWHARGFRACDGHDPEGNVFQLRQGVA